MSDIDIVIAALDSAISDRVAWSRLSDGVDWQIENAATQALKDFRRELASSRIRVPFE